MMRADMGEPRTLLDELNLELRARGMAVPGKIEICGWFGDLAILESVADAVRFTHSYLSGTSLAAIDVVRVRPSIARYEELGLLPPG
jgi:hypothetical protein